MVVESHDLDICGDASAGFAEHGENAEGLTVGAAQNPVEVGVPREELSHG